MKLNTEEFKWKVNEAIFSPIPLQWLGNRKEEVLFFQMKQALGAEFRVFKGTKLR